MRRRKDVSSRVQCMQRLGRQAHDGFPTSKNTRPVKYSEDQVGLVCLCDTACGSCTAVAGFQGFYHRRKSSGRLRGADKVPVLSAKEDRWGTWEIEGA